jgi:succinyl-CoA synthetase beta subunit
MALDGKIVANDNALGRHEDLATMTLKRPSQVYTSLKSSQQKPKSPSVLEASLLAQLDGTIAVICNGAGLTMSILDSIVKAGGQPAACFNLGGETQHYDPIGRELQKALPQADPGISLYQRFEQGLALIADQPTVKVILINVFGSFVSCNQVAESLKTYLQNPRSHIDEQPTFVVRLVGHESDLARSTLAETSIQLVDSLEAAITQAVDAAKVIQDSDVS